MSDRGRTGATAWSVRGLAPADLPACAGVFEAAWRQTFPARPRQIDAAAFAAATQGEWVLVAARDELLGGFVAVNAVESFIHHLYVHPAWQGQGLGRQLLDGALRRLDVAASLKCELANSAALGFYHRLGWSDGAMGVDESGLPWVRLHSPAKPGV